MDSNRIKVFAIIAVALFGAIYLGVAAATAQTTAVAWVGGGIVLSVCLAMGRRIWLLLPLMTGLGLFLPLPGNFSSIFLSQALVLGFCTLLFLMRRLPVQSRITELEIWCLLFLVCVIQVYLRNPVGFSIFGGESIGAKPYAYFGANFCTALLLSVLVVQPNDLKWWVRLSLIGSLGNFFLGALAKFVPAAGFLLGASFSTDVDLGQQVRQGEATRVGFVRGISTTVALWVSSRISPLRGCFSLRFAPLIVLTFVAAAASGYRSQLIVVGLIYLVGLAYRGGFSSIMVSGLLGATGIVLLAFVNAVAPLPANIQRSLTFLPGTWDEDYKRDAKGSTDWRVEMWKEALFTDRWIQNKLLGDGLGFSRNELTAMQNINAIEGGIQETSGLSSGQQTMMINGGYHSGPVQTVRTVGYVGLFVLWLGFIRMAVHAHRQIQRTRGTEWFPYTLFICIPVIYAPISWTLVIGSFDGGAGTLLLGCAMVRMLESNLPLPAWQAPSRDRYVLQGSRGAIPVNPRVSG